MKKILNLLLVTMIGLPVIDLCAQEEEEWPADEVLEQAEKTNIEIADERIELDSFTVVGMQFTLEEEAGLRLIRQALETPRSRKRKDKDVWTCRFRSPLHTHFKHLECAKNGDLMALSPNPTYPTYDKDKPLNQQYGTIMVSERPVNEAKFRNMLEQMPGSADLDREFVSLVLAGMQPPRAFPTDEELDDFAAAYQAVNELDRSGAGDDELITAITEQNLTADRYNSLVELVETYQSIENEVAFRLGTLERPKE
jgi:hypothetical protein